MGKHSSVVFPPIYDLALFFFFFSPTKSDISLGVPRERSVQLLASAQCRDMGFPEVRYNFSRVLSKISHVRRENVKVLFVFKVFLFLSTNALATVGEDRLISSRLCSNGVRSQPGSGRVTALFVILRRDSPKP